MEEHPIPQNITSFEFHLVGDMTLKQFGYLAGGAAVAYLLFVFLFPVNSFIVTPLMAAFLLTGAAFAFLPIGDRPLDHWLAAFLRAVYSPTHGYWKPAFVGKTHISPQDPNFQNRLQIYLSGMTSYSAPAGPLPPPALSPSTLHPQPSPLSPDLPSKEELNELVEMAQQVQTLKKKVSETEAELSRLKAIPQASSQTRLNEDQVKSLAGNLEGLIKQTKDIYQKTVKEEIPAPEKDQKVVVVAPTSRTEKELQLTSSPNIINGIVTDDAGNLLEGVIAIIHDKNNLPVRALKTNKLGQFAGATPLASGVYTLTLEKDGLFFNTFRLDLNGAVLPALKIMSKRGGVN